MTKGELILIISTILGSLTLGVWMNFHLTKRVKRLGVKIVVATIFLLFTLIVTVALIPTVQFLRDRLLFIAPEIPDCDGKIEIYVAEFWKAGQTYSLSIDDKKFSLGGSFLFDRNIYDRKMKGEYCCTLDSCKVQFHLDGSDTVFFISPSQTKRLTVGSFADGTFLITTDKSERVWIKM